MTQDLRLQLKLSVDKKKFDGPLRGSGKALDSLQTAVSQTAKTTTRLESATQRAGKAFLQAHGRIGKYGRQLVIINQLAHAAVATLSRLGRALPRTADAWTNLNNRLRLVTQSETQLLDVRRQLLAISQRTRTNLDANAQLYSRLALAVEEERG